MDLHFPLAVEASGLVKTFGSTRAVDDIDLAVPAGSVYGFLSPDGAGKTTTIRMLATLLRPDGGRARVLGHDIVADADAVRGLVALTGQYASVDEDLTGRENLVLLARLLGHTRAWAKARAGELLDAFGLTGAAGRLASTYSGGWTSPPASSSSLGCCSWTSRPPGWTRAAATSSGSWSGR